MILKVEDALKPFSRTDPPEDSGGSLGNIPRSLSQRSVGLLRRIPYGAAKRKNFLFIPRQLCCEVVNFNERF